MEKNITRLFSFGKKLTGIDVEYFAKGGFWMGMLQGYIMLTGILLSVLFARFLPKVEFGQYQFVVSILATASIAALPGLNSAIMQEVVKGNDGALKKALAYRIKTSILGSIGLLGVAGFFWYTRQDIIFTTVFVVCSLLFPFTSLVSGIASFLNAKQRFSSSFWYQGADRSILFFTLVVSLLLKLPVMWIVIAYIGAIAISNGVLYLVFVTTTKTGENAGQVIRRGKQLTLVLWGVKLLMNADKLLLGYFLGLTKLAVYTISLLFPDAVDTMINTLNSVAFAKLAKTDKKTLWEKIGKIWVVIASIIGVAVLYSILPWLIPHIFGQHYVDSVKPAQVYVLILPALFVFRLCGSWLLARGRNKTYAVYLNGYHAISILVLAVTAYVTKTITLIVLSRVITTYVFAAYTVIRLRTN